MTQVCADTPPAMYEGTARPAKGANPLPETIPTSFVTFMKHKEVL